MVEGAAGGGSRPDHVITPAEVDGWLADSVVKTVTYHRTTFEAADDILAYGVALELSRIGSYGQGFYSSTDPDEPPHGPIAIRVAIKIQQSLRGSVDELGQYIDDLALELRPRERGITPEGAAEIRHELLRLGYDEVVVTDACGDGIDYVIAIKVDTVKVVVGS